MYFFLKENVEICIKQTYISYPSIHIVVHIIVNLISGGVPGIGSFSGRWIQRGCKPLYKIIDT